MKRLLSLVLCVVVFLLIATPAFTQDATAVPYTIGEGDDAVTTTVADRLDDYSASFDMIWLGLAAALVFFL